MSVLKIKFLWPSPTGQGHGLLFLSWRSFAYGGAMYLHQ